MTEFAYEEGRWQPPVAGGEDATLLGFLERQRATFAWKSADLDAAGLQATLSPSTMTLGGMLKHLARFEDDMSSEWLHGREQLPPWNTVDWNADPAWDWRTAVDDSPEQLYTLWRNAVTRSRALFAAAMAEGGPARHAGGPNSPARSLRYILLNMIEEYARHNGHADLIRESIDGRVGNDPPG
jgi:hypothetical protein